MKPDCKTLLIILAVVALALPLHAGELVKPRIEVFKAKRELRLFDSDRLIKTYRVALGGNPVPPKQYQGDMATPEGTYYICYKNPQSLFHLSLGISYPGPKDAERGLKAGLITQQEYKSILLAHAHGAIPPWDTKLGGEVFVHGNGCSRDWTWGCIAVEDADIEELYRLVPVNTPIVIYP